MDGALLMDLIKAILLAGLITYLFAGLIFAVIMLDFVTKDPYFRNEGNRKYLYAFSVGFLWGLDVFLDKK